MKVDGMTEEQNARIESAMVECLEVCTDANSSFKNLTQFIAGLSENPDWSMPEIIELQTRVIRLLLRRGGNAKDL